MAHRVAPVVATIVAAGAAGCAGLPDGKRLIDGPAAQRAIARLIGAPMTESANTVTPTGITGQSFTYFGTALGSRFTLVVFDNQSATRFLLGYGTRPRTLHGVRIVRSRNVVVLYTPSTQRPDLASALRRALTGLH